MVVTKPAGVLFGRRKNQKEGYENKLCRTALSRLLVRLQTVRSKSQVATWKDPQKLQFISYFGLTWIKCHICFYFVCQVEKNYIEIIVKT